MDRLIGDDTTDYGLADTKAFDQALADNTPYNHEFYIKNKACLLNFVSYYESCKQVIASKHSSDIAAHNLMQEMQSIQHIEKNHLVTPEEAITHVAKVLKDNWPQEFFDNASQNPVCQQCNGSGSYRSLGQRGGYVECGCRSKTSHAPSLSCQCDQCMKSMHRK